MTNLHKHYLEQIEAYIAARGMSARDFGEAAVNDTKLVYQLRQGRDPKLSTLQRCMEYIAAHPMTPLSKGRRKKASDERVAA